MDTLWVQPEASQQDSFDMEKELLDVNKRLRVQTGVTPLPDFKRSRPLAVGDAGPDVAQGSAPATSSAREMALQGLPQEHLTPHKKVAPQAPHPAAPTKVPSPEKPGVPSPRNLMPLLEQTASRHD